MLIETKNLLKDLCNIIDNSRKKVAVSVNTEITMMYCQIGKRINIDLLDNQRAQYGKQIVSQVATQLSWSHFIEILPLKTSLEQEFYITMASSGNWGRDRLRKEIDGMLYERTAISQKSDKVVKNALSNLRQNYELTPDLVFKNPYFLDFTGLTGYYSEKSLEDKLVANLEKFIIELGNGFCFVARQKRMIIDGEDSPLGLLLCTEGSKEQIELLQLDNSGIRVAQYLTELPSKEILYKQIKKSLAGIKDYNTQKTSRHVDKVDLEKENEEE